MKDVVKSPAEVKISSVHPISLTWEISNTVDSQLIGIHGD